MKVESDSEDGLLRAKRLAVEAAHPVGGAAGGEDEAEVFDRDREVEVGIGRGGSGEAAGELAPLRTGEDHGGVGEGGAVGLNNDLREIGIVVLRVEDVGDVKAEGFHRIRE